MSKSPRTIWAYLASIALVCGALAVRLVLMPWTDEDTPFVAAVAASAILGGLWPGLVATGLSILVAWLFYGRLYAPDENPAWTLSFFAVEGVLASFICAMLHKARRRAQEHAREATALRDRVISISEAEKRRIGQDLHDGLGQQLTGIALLSQSLAQRLGKRDAPEADEAHRIAAMVRQTIGSTRDLARGLTPVAMEADDLASALKHLADSTSGLFNILCRVEAPENVRAVSQEAAIHLYRIAQEAISNAVKHGHATSIDIHVRDRDHLELRIQDNGVGIDPTANPAGGLGMEIMRHRARLIGATLEVRQVPAGGTLVSCRMSSANGEQRS